MNTPPQSKWFRDAPDSCNNVFRCLQTKQCGKASRTRRDMLLTIKRDLVVEGYDFPPHGHRLSPERLPRHS